VDWEYLSEIMKALGHPVRLRIVDILARGEAHVGALAEEVGVAQATLSQQIAILRNRGLVQRRRESGRAMYALAEPRLTELLRCAKGCRRASAGARGAGSGETAALNSVEGRQG